MAGESFTGKFPSHQRALALVLASRHLLLSPAALYPLRGEFSHLPDCCFHDGLGMECMTHRLALRHSADGCA